MNITQMIKASRNLVKYSALGLAAAAMLGAGSAQAITYANWTFNTGAGADSSGNGHDLGGDSGSTATSPSPWGPSANCSQNTDSGDYSRWDGVPGDPLPTDDFTLGLWVQGADPAYSNFDAGRSSLLASNGDGNDSLWIGALGGNWAVSLGWPGDGNTVLATFAITPATPQHIEVTREAGSYTVYLDGSLVAGPTAAGGFNWNSFHVGINSGGWSHYRGLFGDVLLTDVVARSPEAKIKTFGLPSMPGAIDQGAKTINWPVTYVSDPAHLAAEFDISADATCYDADPGLGGNVIISGTERDFTNPVHYWVTSSDGVFTNDYTVTVEHTPISSAKDILTFGPAGNRAVISGTDITWTVPFGTDLATLAPEYTVSQYFGGSASGSPLSGNAPTPSFADKNPAIYIITAQDSSTNAYSVTINFYPELPTVINVNVSGGDNAYMDGIYSFDFVARGSASRVAPAAYSGYTWNDFGGLGTGDSRNNLKDSTGADTSVGFIKGGALDNGPWNDWYGTINARLLISAWCKWGNIDYTPLITLTGLNPGHKYDLYLVSQERDSNHPTDFKVGGTVQHLELTGTPTDWVAGENYVHFTDVIPLLDGTLLVKAQITGGFACLNAFQVQDMGVRGLNPEAVFYEFSFGNSVGMSATTIEGTTITVNVYAGTGVTALTPTFTPSVGATVKAAGTPVASGDARDFTSPVHYVVTSEDGNTTTDYTVTVNNSVTASGRVNVNIDGGGPRTGLYGPAPLNGLGKVWNKTPGAKSGSNLLDEDGIATSIGFDVNGFEGAGTWGNPALDLLKGAVYWWSQNNGGVQTGEINGLPLGKKYNLYIASLWADSYCYGTISANGSTQSIDGQGASQSTWAKGANYVEFLDVTPDANGKIIITVNTTYANGDNRLVMINGFQLVELPPKGTVLIIW